jgi:ubiquinol-cytochrome c reductase cytochrome b subunit
MRKRLSNRNYFNGSRMMGNYHVRFCEKNLPRKKGSNSYSLATLNRFFSLHYLLPFIIAGLSIVHIAALHQYGSNNPLGTFAGDKVPFTPYMLVKDILGWVVFSIFFSIFVYFYPNLLGHPDNYIPANPMSTPAHIVPEWYFLRAPSNLHTAC